MKTFSLYILSLSLLAGPAAAQDTLSLAGYRQRVLDYSYTLRQAAEGAKGASATVRATRTGLLPQLSADGDFSVSFKRRYTAGDQPLKPYAFSLQPAIVQNIYSGGSARNSYEQAQVGEDIARLRQQESALEVAYLAEYNYWSLASNEALMRVSSRYEQIVREMFDVVLTRFNDGYIAKTDLLMIQTRLREAEFSRVQAEKLYLVSRQNFNVLMGVSPDDPHRLADSVTQKSELPRRTEPGEAIAGHPNYRIAERQVDFQQYNAKLAAAKFNPQLSAGVQGVWRNQTPNAGGTEVDGLTFLRLSVPIFHWGERRHTAAASESAVRSAEYARDQTADNMTLEISSAWTGIIEATIQIGIARANLEVALENLSLNTFSYNEGQLTILDVISAQLSWLQAYTNTVTASFNEKVAISAYRKAANIE